MNRSSIGAIVSTLLLTTCAFGQEAGAGGSSSQVAVAPQFHLLRFGEVLPTAWIQAQMRRDLDGGFAGHMQEIAPRTARSDAFAAGRNRPGHLSTAAGVNIHWWNGETEGNWRCGNTMMILLAGTAEQRAALEARIGGLLKSADADGYLGIYDPDLRWRGAGDVTVHGVSTHRLST